MQISIPCEGMRDVFLKQALIIYWGKLGNVNIEIKILSHMLRNNTNGIYIIKWGYIDILAKVFKCKKASVSTALNRLKKKQFITFVSGSRNNHIGSYHFMPALEQLCKQHESIEFIFNSTI